MKIRKVIFLILVMMFLAACAPDPRKEANAQKTLIESNQAALDAEQARAIRQTQADAEKVKSDYWQAVWDSALGTAQEAANTTVRFVGWSLTIALCVVVLGAAWTVKETSIGLGRTFVRFAEVRAGLIHMDKSTRTFPGFVDVRQLHGTRFVAMLATGQVLKLDAAQSADRQLIAALAQVATTGAAMQEMRTANDARGMAMFQPDIVSAADGALPVGSEFIKCLEGSER